MTHARTAAQLKRLRFHIISGTLIAASAVFASPAFAKPPIISVPPVKLVNRDAKCTAYAELATGHYATNIKNSCGQSGGRWSSNFAGHKAWCFSASDAAVDAETAARAQALNRCKGPCETYGQTAVQQNKTAVKNDCGVSGGRWSDDLAGHKAWCISVDDQAAKFETDSREAALDYCTSFCANYANLARKQNEEANELKCGLAADGRWSDDVADHKRRCARSDRNAATAEVQARMAILSRCKITQKFEPPTLLRGRLGARTDFPHKEYPVRVCARPIVGVGGSVKRDPDRCDQKKTAAMFCEQKGFNLVDSIRGSVVIRETGDFVPTAVFVDLDYPSDYCPGTTTCEVFARIDCRFPK